MYIRIQYTIKQTLIEPVLDYRESDYIQTPVCESTKLQHGA